MSQNGNAGRDLIQVGRDYIRYIQFNFSTGHWGAAILALLPLLLFLYGVKAAGDKAVQVFTSSGTDATAETQSPSASIPTASVTPETSTPKPSPSNSSPVARSPGRCVAIIADGLYVRTQPNKDSASVDTLQWGDKPTTTGEERDGWLKISSPAEGWINGGSAYTQPCDRPMPPRPSPTVNTNQGEQPTKTTSQTNPPSQGGSNTNTSQADADAAAQKAAEDRAAAEERQREIERQQAEERQRELERQQAEAAAARRRAMAASGCAITISHGLVSLKSEPDTFSRSLTRVPPGEYAPADHIVIDRGHLGQIAWFQISAGGRTGWIEDSTWGIDAKTSGCP